MCITRPCLLTIMCFSLFPASSWAERKLRVATYNVQFLKAIIPQQR